MTTRKFPSHVHSGSARPRLQCCYHLCGCFHAILEVCMRVWAVTNLSKNGLPSAAGGKTPLGRSTLVCLCYQFDCLHGSCGMRYCCGAEHRCLVKWAHGIDRNGRHGWEPGAVCRQNFIIRTSRRLKVISARFSMRPSVFVVHCA